MYKSANKGCMPTKIGEIMCICMDIELYILTLGTG